MEACKNCERELTGAYCAACGQKASTQRMGWAWLAHELQHTLFHVDKGLLFTLKELFTRPGRSIREFLEGHRVRHFKPFATVIITATVYSLLYRLMRPTLNGITLNKDMAQLMELWNQWMGQYYAFLELAMLPLFALCTWVVMRKYGHNYVEHLVIQAYIAAQRIVVSIVFLPLNLLGTAGVMLSGSILWVAYTAGFILTLAQLYNDRPAERVVLRAFVALLLFFSTLMVILTAAGVAYIALQHGH
ncbi:MAG: DUF3667 domain-containing protein [Flavobacteriales bacterium]|nr:DUF3667 domain-containing protein [Flavobacteriales bacterium]